MSDFDSLFTDPEKERKGVWVRHPKGGEFLLARMDNPEYLDALRKASEPYREALRKDPEFQIPDGEADKVLGRALVGHIVLDWRGWNRGDTPVPYTRDRAYEVLCQPGARDLRRWIVESAANPDHFRLPKGQTIDVPSLAELQDEATEKN